MSRAKRIRKAKMARKKRRTVPILEVFIRQPSGKYERSVYRTDRTGRPVERIER